MDTLLENGPSGFYVKTPQPFFLDYVYMHATHATELYSQFSENASLGILTSRLSRLYSASSGFFDDIFLTVYFIIFL